MKREPPHSSPGASDDDLTCQQVTALLVEYFTEALAPKTLQALQEHLRICEDCLAFLNTYRATIQTTRTLRYDDMPAALQDRLLSFLRTRMTRAPPYCPSETDQG